MFASLALAAPASVPPVPGQPVSAEEGRVLEVMDRQKRILFSGLETYRRS
jgi:hypothetical protein